MSVAIKVFGYLINATIHLNIQILGIYLDQSASLLVNIVTDQRRQTVKVVHYFPRLLHMHNYD